MHTRRCRSYSRSTLLLGTRTSISRSHALGKIEDGFRRLYTRVPTTRTRTRTRIRYKRISLRCRVRNTRTSMVHTSTYINYTSRYAIFQTVAARDLEKMKFDANVEARRPGIDTNIINYARMKARPSACTTQTFMCRYLDTSIRVYVYTYSYVYASTRVRTHNIRTSNLLDATTSSIFLFVLCAIFRALLPALSRRVNFTTNV